MKKVWLVLVPMLAFGTALHGENGGPGGTVVDVVNQIGTSQSQDVSTTSIAEGGSSWNDNKSASTSQVSINTNSVSNYETRTAPLTTFPPYLPYWTHGGWGTVKAYFPNSPTVNDTVYETVFDPESPEDMRELRSVLKALPHAGLAEAVGGVFNGLAVALFDAPNRYHHGRGLEIANSITRDRRPEGKPLLVFIDSNVDVALLRDEGYVYVGKVSIEGDVERNWDHAYKAAVAEALLWDTDVLLVSGGMKGVTVGSNVTFPSAAAGYSQVNYSLSLFGAKATGITEGRGKAVLSADAYRFNPGKIDRRRIPESLYDRIRARPQPVSREVGAAPAASVSSAMSVQTAESAELPGVADSPRRPQSEQQGATQNGRVLPPPEPQDAGRYEQLPPRVTPQSQAQAEPSTVCADSLEPQVQVSREQPQPASAGLRNDSPQSGVQVSRDLPRAVTPTGRSESRKPGIRVRRELLAMAGFHDPSEIMYVSVR